MSIVAPILPEYAETFNVNYTLVGFAVATFGIGRIFFDLPTGLLAKKYNLKKIMLLGLSLVILSSFLAGIAPQYGVLLLARLIEGIGSSLYVTTSTIYLALTLDPKKRGRLMSLYAGFLLLGTIFGPSLGGFIASIYGIRAPFYVYAVVVALGIIPTLILPNVENSSVDHKDDSQKFSYLIWESLKNQSFLLVFPAIFVIFFIRTGVRSTLVPLYSGSNLNLTEGDIGFILTIAGIATAVTMVPIGNLSDRIGRRLPLILSLILTIFPIMWIPFSNSAMNLTIAIIIYGAFVGLSGPIAAYVTDIAPPEKVEIYMGVYRTVGDLGFVIGPLLSGFVADLTSSSTIRGESIINMVTWPPFAMAAIIMLISAIILLKAPNPIQNKSHNQIES